MAEAGATNHPASEPLPDFDGLLPWDRLQPWIMDSDCPGEGPVRSVERLTGGSQNAIFLLEREGARFVLRRPPLHPRADAERGTARELLVLGALGSTDVPHPRLLAACDDPTVIGASFSLMDLVEGFTPLFDLPPAYAANASWRQAIGIEMAAAAAELAAVDPAAVGLERLGKPEGWLERQVPRYRRMLNEYRALDGYDATDLPHIDAVAAWLEANRPNESRIGIVHGDFQFANVMFAHDAPRLIAIVDWDMASLGDPLLDLAWSLTAWVEPDDPPGREPNVRPWTGFSSPAEIAAEYGRLTGRDMAGLPWFFVLACYRLAILLEGTHARAAAGQASKETGDQLHRVAVWLLAKADRQIRAT